MQSIRQVYVKSLSFLLFSKKEIYNSKQVVDNQFFISAFRKLSKSLFLIVMLSALTFFSCNRSASSTAKPLILLSEEQMTVILMDVHLVEGTINFKRNIGQGVDDQKSELYNQLMEEHGVTPEILESNLLYYNLKPEVLERIYEEVITRLSIMQTEIMVEKDIE